MELIRLTDVMDYARTGAPFSIKYITADVQRKTAGAVKYYAGVRMKNIPKQPSLGVPSTERDVTPLKSKNPRHDNNGTMNIILANRQIKKVHVRLIIGFNDKKVVY